MIIRRPPRLSPQYLRPFPSRRGAKPGAVQPGQPVHKPDASLDAPEEIGEVEFFVWRMDAVARKGKAHQHGRHTKRVLEDAQDRDRAARAQEYRRLAEALAVGEGCRPDRRMPRINNSGLGA